MYVREGHMSNLPVLEASAAAVLDAKGGRIGRLSFRGGGSRSNTVSVSARLPYSQYSHVNGDDVTSFGWRCRSPEPLREWVRLRRPGAPGSAPKLWMRWPLDSIIIYRRSTDAGAAQQGVASANWSPLLQARRLKDRGRGIGTSQLAEF